MYSQSSSQDHLLIKTTFTGPQRYTFHGIEPAYKDRLCIRTTSWSSLWWFLYKSFTVFTISNKLLPLPRNVWQSRARLQPYLTPRSSEPHGTVTFKRGFVVDTGRIIKARRWVTRTDASFTVDPGEPRLTDTGEGVDTVDTGSVIEAGTSDNTEHWEYYIPSGIFCTIQYSLSDKTPLWKILCLPTYYYCKSAIIHSLKWS